MAKQENVITHTYDLLKYIIPQLAKYPKTQKFVLADKVQNSLTEVLENLIEAYYTDRRSKLPILKKVNIQLEKLRYLVRLSYDTRCINQKRYQIIQVRLHEIGAQVGGWQKSLS